MATLVEEIKKLKNHIDRDDVVSILENLGYEFNKNKKFRLREEATPSAVVYKNGRIKDFGDDTFKSGDIFDVLTHYHNMSKKEAVLYISNYIGVAVDVYGEITKPKPAAASLKEKKNKESEEVLDQESIKNARRMLRIFDTNKDLITFSHTGYRASALSIAPMWVWQEASKDALDTFKSLTTYDSKQETIVLKIARYDGYVFSYKHRYKTFSNGEVGKWITAHGTHPNSQCLYHYVDDNPVFVVEGHRDFLTCILLGINVFMIPSVEYTTFSDEDLKYLKGKELIFVPDIDIHKKSIDAMTGLIEQVGKTALRASLVNLKHLLVEERINPPVKLDLTTVAELWELGKDALISVILLKTEIKEIF